MRLRTRILLVMSAPFLCFFAFGITNVGQRLLVGDLPKDIDHWRADDIAMGAGLTPWVYGLFPFIVLFVSGLTSWLIDFRRKVKATNN